MHEYKYALLNASWSAMRLRILAVRQQWC